MTSNIASNLKIFKAIFELKDSLKKQNYASIKYLFSSQTSKFLQHSLKNFLQAYLNMLNIWKVMQVHKFFSF